MSGAEQFPSSEPPTSGPPASERSAPPLRRGVMLAALAILLLFVGSRGWNLWREWRTLQAEMVEVRSTSIVGYPGITPQYSLARWPRDWHREEGASVLLWGGWRDGGHTWFRVERGDLDHSQISEPLGRDVIRAIDYPLVEQGGGRFWSRIPDDAIVVGTRQGGVDIAYPMLVLDKVLVVNDVVGEQPFLVLNTPTSPENERTTVYDPVVEGRRLTMGLSGYFHDRGPVLYDRATESLWVVGTDGLRAVSGKYKGRRLSRLGRLTTSPWSAWRSRHPSSRLVVGADRSHARPDS